MDSDVRSTRATSHRVLALAVAVFALGFASDALAYLDPGTGSVLVQGTIATVAGAVTWLSLGWRSAKAWLRSKTARSARIDGKGGGTSH